MAKTYEVPAEIREDVGKGASRRLRREDKVPAVVYGGTRKPVPLTLEHDYILHAADDEAFHASVLNLKVGDGRTQKVILRDLQRHAFKPRIEHVDFQRVREDTELRLEVPLHFVNEEESPAGRKGGVVISYNYTELEIAAKAKDLPEYLAVDLINLEPGGRIMMSEIPLPEGVLLPALEYGDEDADAAVVSAIYIREGQGTGELAAEADALIAEAEAESEVVDEEEAEAIEEAAEEADEEGEGEGEGGTSGETSGSKENPPDKKVEE
ncbi:MAG: 50S ribosomal protein L25/general stress protein Ctc [Candidatus Wenzhouxiangella sp. M2_3B_020]